MPLRLLLLLLALLLALAACDPKNGYNPQVRIASISNLTPAINGDITVTGSGFSSQEPNTITIGDIQVPAKNIRHASFGEIELRVPENAPNGLLTVTNSYGNSATYPTPLQIITDINVEPLEAIPGTRRYPITAHVTDAHGEPVPGAPLLFYVSSYDPDYPVTLHKTVATDSQGSASVTVDLEGIPVLVEFRVSADGLSSVATYKNPPTYPLGREVILSDETTSMPVYLNDAGDGQVYLTTLNYRQQHPPIPQTSIAATALRARYEPDEIIVAYEPTLTLTSAARLNALDAAGVRRERSVAGLDLVRVPGDQRLEEALARLNADPRVAYAEPNHRLYLASLPSDPSLYQQWGAFAVGAPAAWTTQDGAGVTVAVIDGPISSSQPDLEGALLPGYDFCAGYDNCNSYDEDPHRWGSLDHGTHVASIIAARARNGFGTVGIAPGASILPVKVFPTAGDYTDVLTIATAIRWAAGLPIAGVPDNLNPADVINLSLGGPDYSYTLQRAVNDARAQGAVVVAATGNDGRASVSYPAALTGVIGVAAIDEDGTRGSYSNYGTGVDLAAPGTLILASAPGNGTQYMTGTSMATPHVAAAAALLLADDPTLTPEQVEDRLKASAYLPTGASASGYGAGIIRVDGALGHPAPTSDDDRYATLTIDGNATTLDLRDGASPTLDLQDVQERDSIQISLTHRGHNFTGTLTDW